MNRYYDLTGDADPLSPMLGRTRVVPLGAAGRELRAREAAGLPATVSDMPVSKLATERHARPTYNATRTVVEFEFNTWHVRREAERQVIL